MTLLYPDIIMWPLFAMLTVGGLLIQLVCCYFIPNRLVRLCPTVLIGILTLLALALYAKLPLLNLLLPVTGEESTMMLVSLSFLLLGVMWGWLIYRIDSMRRNLKSGS